MNRDGNRDNICDGMLNLVNVVWTHIIVGGNRFGDCKLLLGYLQTQIQSYTKVIIVAWVYCTRFKYIDGKGRKLKKCKKFKR